MTLGPAFGAPPPSDFNEPHSLHPEPAPENPDHAHREDASADDASALTSGPPAEQAEPTPATKKGGLFGWLRRG